MTSYRLLSVFFLFMSILDITRGQFKQTLVDDCLNNTKIVCMSIHSEKMEFFNADCFPVDEPMSPCLGMIVGELNEDEIDWSLFTRKYVRDWDQENTTIVMFLGFNPNISASTGETVLFKPDFSHNFNKPHLEPGEKFFERIMGPDSVLLSHDRYDFDSSKEIFFKEYPKSSSNCNLETDPVVAHIAYYALNGDGLYIFESLSTKSTGLRLLFSPMTTNTTTNSTMTTPSTIEPEKEVQE